MTLTSNQSLSLIATNEILINPGTSIEGSFEAKIVSCPVGPGKIANPSLSEPDSLLLKPISLEPDLTVKKLKR